jgi:hypothetical protein
MSRSGQLLMFVDTHASELLGWRGDEDTMAAGFERIE